MDISSTLLIALLPLLGVVVTWLLGEYGQRRRSRREEHLAIGRTLTDLLLIRRRLKALTDAIKEVNELITFTPQQNALLEEFANSLLPELEGWSERYNESIKVVSGIKPVLGFRLSKENWFTPVTSKLRQIALSDEQFASLWMEMKSHISEPSRLDKIIRDLAWLHGWKTWLQVRKELNNPLETPSDFKELIGSYIPQGLKRN